MRSISGSTSLVQTPTRRRRILLTGLTAATALVIAGCGVGDSGSGTDPAAAGSGGAAAGSQSSATWNKADVAFAQMMIPDHQMVGEMATIAQKKATTADLKALSKKMKTGQSKAADKLSGWLTEWGQPTTAGATGEKMPGAMTEADMTMLTSMKKGMDFDMMFAQMMVDHHKGAISMAQDEVANGKNAEAKAMASSMVTTLQGQVTQLEKIASMKA